MNSRRLLFVSGFALFGTVSGSVAAFKWVEESTRVRRHFGLDVWRVIEEAERVEVYRLRKPGPEESTDWGRRGWPAEELRTGPPVIATREWSERLLAILRHPRSYLWNAAKPCTPTPGVVARFHRGGEQVDVHFCFECDLVSIAPTGSTRWEDFDPVRAQLAGLMKEVLPSDPAIQAL